MRTDLRQERLAWLAARPYLDRIHRKWWHVLTRVMRARNRPRGTVWIRDHIETDDLSKSLQQASLVIDDLAGRFSPYEREVLRRTGLLPEWFWPAYLAEFEAASRR
ncbi:MAG: hypothetical protein ACJ71T_00235 [Actinomycetales bacterium]